MSADMVEFFLGMIFASIYWGLGLAWWRLRRPAPPPSCCDSGGEISITVDPARPLEPRPQLLPAPPDLWFTGPRTTCRCYLAVGPQIVCVEIFGHDRRAVGAAIELLLAGRPATAAEMADPSPGQIKIIFPPGSTPAGKEASDESDLHTPRG